MSQKFFLQGKPEAEAIADIAKRLIASGYLVATPNYSHMPWLVLTARTRASIGWTGCYAGLTAKGRVPRDWLKISGPEEDAIAEVLAQAAEATP